MFVKKTFGPNFDSLKKKKKKKVLQIQFCAWFFQFENHVVSILM